MKQTRFVLITLALCVVVALAGCATGGKKRAKETIPIVKVSPNSSGIEVQAYQSHGPKNLLGEFMAMRAAPDIPSGVSLSTGSTRPLHRGQPRYYAPASGSLEIVSLERPSDYARLEDETRRWKLLTDQSLPAAQARKILYTDQLSEIPWINAGRCFHAKLRQRTFSWGTGVLFLTSYVQGSTGGPVSNDRLLLVIEGFTTDGRYAINGRFAIHHPELPSSLWDDKTKGKVVFSIDHDDEKAEKWLDAQPDDSFQPTILQYETFLQSLQIIPPPKT